MIQNRNGFILFNKYFGTITEKETGETVNITHQGVFIRLIPIDVPFGREKYEQFCKELEDFIERWGCERLPIYEECVAHTK